MGGAERELLILGTISIVPPLIICGILGFFYKPGPLMLGTVLTWVSLFAVWDESISRIFQVDQIKGFIVTASFFLSSFLTTITGGIYLLVSPDRRSKSGNESSS